MIRYKQTLFILTLKPTTSGAHSLFTNGRVPSEKLYMWEHVAQSIGRWNQDQKVPALAMCRNVGQASYSTLPLSTQL